jgi:phage/plasmid-associated DNA primase
MGEEVSRWMYALIGRLIYEVNELDGWQVLPFLKGAASSGKSTILTRVCRNLYEASEVGTLSNNIERKFGLSALADKLLFIGPEIKSDIALEQAEFQSIVSGETVQVAAKFKTATTVVWRVPGALAGNEVPGWVDNSGSINRRIVIFDFPRRVHDGDMELGRKIELEMPSTLVKCNRAYLEAVARYAKDNIWKHLPAAFHASKDDFSESINSIVHFLRSGQLEYGTGHYMPFENFASAYEAYVASMGLTRMKLTGDKVSQPLLEANCRVVKNQTMRYPRPAAAGAAAGSSGAAAGSSFGGGGFGSHASSVMTGRFIIGCDVAPRVAQQMCFSGQGDDLPF